MNKEIDALVAKAINRNATLLMDDSVLTTRKSIRAALMEARALGLEEAAKEHRAEQVKHAQACMAHVATRRILQTIVDLDSDAHPGLSTWHEMRAKAHADAIRALKD